MASPIGGSFAFNRVKLLAVRNLDASYSVTIGSGTTPWIGDVATASVITIPPSGLHLILSPLSGFDASTTARILTVGSDGIASCDILILGTK
jgi:hypothetical protein